MKLDYNPGSLRFNQEGRVHNDSTYCPFCHDDMMKLVDISDGKKWFRCTKCEVLMSEDIK